MRIPRIFPHRPAPLAAQIPLASAPAVPVKPPRDAFMATTPPGSGGGGPKPVTWIDYVPKLAIGAVNNVVSFWGAVGVKAAVEMADPNWSATYVSFGNTMIYSAVALCFFGGLWFFNLLPAPAQRAWAHAKGLARFVPTWWSRFQTWTDQPKYWNRFVRDGFIGMVRLMKDRQSTPITWLTRAKKWLSSRPLTGLLRSIAGKAIARKLAPALTAAQRASTPDTTAALDAEINRRVDAAAERITYWGNSVYLRVPESTLDFFGRITPGEKAKVTGLGLEIGAQTLSGAIEAVIFPGGSWSLSTVAQSSVINTLGAYANAVVTQEAQRDPNAPATTQHVSNTVWLHRMVIGIFKGAIYRGICTARTVGLGLGLLIQYVAGLAFIAYANRVTGQQLVTPNPFDKEAHRAALRKDVQRRLGILPIEGHP